MHILVVDDDDTLRMTLSAKLRSMGHEVTSARDGREALDIIETRHALKPANTTDKSCSKGYFDAAVIDVSMPKVGGLEVLSRIKDLSPATFCLIATAYTNIKDAVTAMKNGAYDYIQKPIEPTVLQKLLEDTQEAARSVQEAAFSAPTLHFGDGKIMVGGSSSIKKVFDVIYKLSKVDTSVLIRGESGTGKELVARALHLNSHRKKGPFLAVNCGALSENLIESELFGHEKGAFTGADRKKIGKFIAAEGGTLFLDEIGDMKPTMQVKLLRVLQERMITPVGSNIDVATDVRVIAATHRNLESMVEKGEFRADLFYRLNILPINLPPLRDRAEDISELVRFLFVKFNKLHGRKVSQLADDALDALRCYEWPGNIRELENVIERAFILSSGDVIQLSDLADQFQKYKDLAQAQPVNIGNSENILNFPALKEKFEKDFIIKALTTYKGRINQTAEHTEMTKVTLLRKLDKYGINPREFHAH